MIEIPFPILNKDDALSYWLDEHMPNNTVSEIPRWQVLLNTGWNDWAVTIQFRDEKDATIFTLRWS